MYPLPVSQLVILAGVVLSFVLFGLALMGVSIFVKFAKPRAPAPQARAVTPARRVDARVQQGVTRWR
jgi:hypothetical protein